MFARRGIGSVSLATVLLTGLFLMGPPPALSGTAPSVDKRAGVAITEYRDMFLAILENLRTNYGSPDGNWQGDWMYDAPALAPKALYRYGIATGDLDLIDKANATLDRNLDLLLELFAGESTNPVEALMAVPSGLEAIQFYSGEKYQNFPMELVGWVSLGLTKGLVEQTPNPLGDYLGYVFALGSYAYAGLDFAAIVRGISGFTTAAWGLSTLELANERYWVEESHGGLDYGYYWDDDPSHPRNERMDTFVNGPMMVALAGAYGVTRNDEHRTRAEALLAGIDARLWDEERGGYAAHLARLDMKPLSSNNAVVNALLELYNVTGENTYLNRARETLDFIERDLFIEDLTHPGYFICSHDWKDGYGASPVFCTGCNFAQLYSIYRLNELVQKGPAHPNPIPICGQGPADAGDTKALILYTFLLLSPLLLLRRLRAKPFVLQGNPLRSR